MSTLKTNNIQHVDRSDPSIIINTDGSVNIAGTMTYEDVTNVDAVGIITGRNNIDAQKQVLVGTGVSVKAGGLNVTAGITTVQALQATTGTFSSAVSGTTGTFTGDVDIADKIIHTGDTNTAIRFPSVDNISFETDGGERVRITSSMLGINTTSVSIAGMSRYLSVSARDVTNGGGAVEIVGNRTGSDQTLGVINFVNDASNVAQITAKYQGSTTSGSLQFFTSGSERLRIDSDGTVDIGGGSHSRNLTVHSATNSVILIEGNSDATSSLMLGDNDDEDVGMIQYNHASNFLAFTANTAEIVRINSSGNLLIGHTSSRDLGGLSSQKVVIEGTSGNAAIGIINNQNSGGFASLRFSKSRGTSVGSNTIVQSGDPLGGIVFCGADGNDMTSVGAQILAEVDGTPGSNDMPARLEFFTTPDGSASPTERMRIDRDGRVLIGTTTEGEGTADDLTIATSGSTGITIRSGTTNEGNIFFSDGTSGVAEYRGTIQYDHNDDRLVIFTNGTERMRIDSDGEMAFTAAKNGQVIHQFKNTDTTSGSSAMTVEHHFNFNRTGGSMNSSAARIIAGKEREWIGGASNQDGYLAFHTIENESSTEKMRIVSQGRLRIKCEDFTDDPSSSNRGVMIGDSSTGTTFSNGSSTGTANNIIFINGNGLVGKISTSGSSTTYHTSSDYRLKENAVAISDGITRLKTLKPYRFNFKADASTTLDGFFAHEVSPAVPEAVEGTKDEVYTEDWNEYKVGDPKIQSIDQSKLVPLLTAALQEEIAKREALEVRIAAIEKIAGI